MELKEKIAILSGRYELIHPGHVQTIRRFARLYKTLYVYIVDNPNSIIPIQWNKMLLDYCTIDFPNVITVLDSCHFGYATPDDIDRLPIYDDFLCGNKIVAEHLKTLGVRVVEFEESTGYSSTNLKEKILQDMVRDWREKTGK